MSMQQCSTVMDYAATNIPQNSFIYDDCLNSCDGRDIRTKCYISNNFKKCSPVELFDTFFETYRRKITPTKMKQRNEKPCVFKESFGNSNDINWWLEVVFLEFLSVSLFQYRFFWQLVMCALSFSLAYTIFKQNCSNLTPLITVHHQKC